MVQWAALGAATAQSVERISGAVDFIGSGEPISTAIAFQMIATVAAAGSRVVFPGARYSRQSVQHLLADEVQGMHLEVYDNRPITDPAPRPESVSVFAAR